MSGFGERFRRAGYSVPKPLIHVEGKPIIAHVVDLFPGEHDFTFICNSDHLDHEAWRMEEVLRSLAKSVSIISISPHKLGPVHAVLQAVSTLDLESPVVVNYADFSCRWDFGAFLQDTHDRQLDASVPAYRGFHPHSSGTTNYAYIRERDGFLLEIQEKQPFTTDKTAEFASSGAYFFRTARLMKDVFTEQMARRLSVGGEYYASSAVGILAEKGARVGVYELQHFMQWGTPEDLTEYEGNSRVFRALGRAATSAIPIVGTGPSLILASGAGQRFKDAGYSVPKPLLPLNRQPMAAQAAAAVESSLLTVASCSDEITAVGLASTRFDETYLLPKPSRGQAESAAMLVGKFSDKLLSFFSIFPCDTLVGDASDRLEHLVGQDGDFLIVWVQQPTMFSRRKPETFGWVWLEDETARTALKEEPDSDEALIMTGIFTFSSVFVFERLYEDVMQTRSPLQAEVLLDHFVEAAQKFGIHVVLFEPEVVAILGTPFEYETFRYWQDCFDGWAGHPYRREVDPFAKQGLSARGERGL